VKKILRVLSVIIIICSILANLNIANAVEPESIEKDNTPTDNEGMLLEENEDNNSEDSIYRMDEDGNIFEATDLDLPGLVEEEENFIQPYSIQEQVAVVNFNRGVNAVTNYVEAGTGRSGYTHGQYGADAAYLEHSADGRQVKFMLSDVVGWVDASQVQIVRYDNANVRTLSYYTVNSNGRIIHNISTNINSTTHGTALTVGLASATPYLRTGVRYYSYDGHYFYDNSDGNGYSRMLRDYRNGVRTNSVNPNNPYYNYFQYLPHRSTTNYTAAELDRYLLSRIPNDPQSKMINSGASFINSQNTHGVNALLMYGVAINESNWGRSNIAQTRNNLFGHAAYDSNPGNATGYATVADSIEHHANGFLSRGYLNANDWRYGGSHVGSKGSGVNIQYASDPYWGVKAAANAWILDITLGPKDAYKYTIGIKDTLNTGHTLSTVRNAANTSATSLYTTAPGATTHAISNYPFIVLNESPQNGFYTIQSDTTLNANRTATNPTGLYSFSRDYAFMPTTNTYIANQGNFKNEMSVNYSTHVESHGWLPYVRNGATGGTTGESKRLEAIKINIAYAPYSGGIEYQSHIESNGWESSWRSNDAVSGTNNQSKRLEAIRIRLTGELAQHYDVYYRVHSEKYGWLGWAKNGEDAGTSGYSLRLEAIEVQLVAKNGNAPTSNFVPFMSSSIVSRAHVEFDGWQDAVKEGETLGTIGESKRLEAIQMQLNNSPYSGSIRYRSHVESNGWESNWSSNNQSSGTQGESKRLEALQIELTGEMAKYFDIYYRVHVEHFGWLDWTRNGNSAGTSGFSYRMEAIEVVLYPKGHLGPSGNGAAFLSR